MDLAPIVLFVYNRPIHAKQTLNALKANTLASESSLFVYCDGPKENASPSEIQKILDVKDLVKSQQWCKDVTIIESENNLGLAKSVIEGVTEVIKEYKKVIVLEDDIITGKHFLDFMNRSLTLYKNDFKVFGVSGYKYPSFHEIKSSTFFLPIACSWSYATWLDRWNSISFDGEALLREIDQRKLKTRFNFGNYQFYEMLTDQVAHKIDSWAIRFYASMFLEHKVFLFPNKSLVQNIGLDSSGTNCIKDDFFSVPNFSNDEIFVEEQEVTLDEEIVKLVRQSFLLNNSYSKQNKTNRSNLLKKGKLKLRRLLRNGRN